ncbi:hypothetical protein GC174_00140 [bacterium]|nr:hypothetical protein [bacterium]
MKAPPKPGFFIGSLLTMTVLLVGQSASADDLLSAASPTDLKDSGIQIDKLDPAPAPANSKDYAEEEEEEATEEEEEREAEKSRTNNEPITVYEDEEEDELAVRKGKAKIYLTISVPRNKKSVVKVEAYPYPPKPPKSTGYGVLPTEPKEVKDLLVNHGYLGRVAMDDAYPAGGWRFQYALARAVRKSGKSVPHSILTHYRWADGMIAYLTPELEAVNKVEEARQERFKKYQEQYSNNYALHRNTAVRTSVEKVRFFPLPNDRHKKGMNFGGVLKDGKWWILASHKAPGLTYFWIEEVDLKNDDRKILEFNESNAICINGGW